MKDQLWSERDVCIYAFRIDLFTVKSKTPKNDSFLNWISEKSAMHYVVGYALGCVMNSYEQIGI